MKIVFAGGAGLIGCKAVANPRPHGHEAVAASPDAGATTVAGEGLDVARIPLGRRGEPRDAALWVPRPTILAKARLTGRGSTLDSGLELI